MGNPRFDDEQATRTEQRIRAQRPRRWRVLFHNDDYTTMDFVLDVLKRHFGKNDAEAMHVMLKVHHEGIGIAGVYPRDTAETKVERVMGEAREQGMPLKVTAEPEGGPERQGGGGEGSRDDG